ncbi:unnamed protein product [Dibothriocephalus latus]|uniref:Uncharacterized protein n=1 Tax=Dibothriocephalus latus TaxID=60516 RepID=A0A3P7LVU1_DIBLA|nr:unnamed protein product [Dibothriocephalus latus]
MSQSPTKQQQQIRPKLCSKIYKTSCGTLISLANEPSLAFYRIQEHVHKTAPQLAEERLRIVVTESKLRGVCYDLGHIIKCVSIVSSAYVSWLLFINQFRKFYAGLSTDIDLYRNN